MKTTQWPVAVALLVFSGGCLAQQSGSGSAGAQAGASGLAPTLVWKGDLRYRHEFTDAEEASTDQTRHRIRARLGLTAQVNDKLSAVFQLATTGGNNDPRSTNQTLGDGMTRKGVGLDLAYADWRPLDGLSVQAGKTPYGWLRTGSLLWDADIAWEGGHVRYETGPFFGSVAAAWLSESATGGDASLLTVQLGAKAKVGEVTITGALSHHDAGGVRGRITNATPGCVAHGAFFGGALGNTTYLDDGCMRLQEDFDLLGAQLEAEFELADMPLVMFADYLHNRAARNGLDTAYAVGVTLGKARDPRTWELGYLYQDVEKDAQFGQFTDSDFAGGITDVSGSVFRGAYAPARNWTVVGTYAMARRFNSTVAKRDYDRLQLDLNFRF